MSGNPPTDSPPPGLPLTQGIDLSSLHNAPFAGLIVSITLFGVLLVQVWNYTHANRDKWYLQVLVVAVFVMDIAVTVLNILPWQYIHISHFGDLLALQSNTTFLYQMSAVMITVTIRFLVHLFFGTRVLFLNRLHRVVPYFVFLCAIGAYVTGIVLGADGIIIGNQGLFTESATKVKFGVSCALAALTDLAVTFALVKTFHTSKTGFKRTDTLLQKLFQYTLTRGILVTLQQLILTVVYLARPETLDWSTMFYWESKFYIITMLAMLNSRPALREGNAEVLPFNPATFQSSQTGTAPSQDKTVHGNDLELKMYPSGHLDLSVDSERNTTSESNSEAKLTKAKTLWNNQTRGVHITREQMTMP